MTTLGHAFDQWANRPADQRFGGDDEGAMAALQSATLHHREASVEATDISLRQCRIDTLIDGISGDRAPVLVGPNGVRSSFTHYAFGQLARNVGAPAGYLRGLPAPLAVANLNEGLAKLPEGDAPCNLLFTQNGDLRLRALTSERYTRIWNSDVVSRLIALRERAPEWKPAPAAFDGSRGLYASDEDMFAFLVDNDRRIFEKGPGGGLGRGFFVWNSEVGAASFGIMTFLYEYVCGNHRVWGAQGVHDLRIRHVGNADHTAFASMAVELRKYADSSAAGDELRVEAAQKHIFGATKDEVLDAVFGIAGLGISRKVLSAGYDKAVERTDWYGSPNSAWGISGGLTEIARDLPVTSERVRLDRAAGKIVQIAF